MKKIIMGILILAIVCLVVSGCTIQVTKVYCKSKYNRFKIVDQNNKIDNIDECFEIGNQIAENQSDENCKYQFKFIGIECDGEKCICY